MSVENKEYKKMPFVCQKQVGTEGITIPDKHKYPRS